MRSSAFAAVRRTAWGSIATFGLSRPITAAALSTLGRPRSGVPWMTWRCRLESDTASSSTTPSVPTPAAARYSSPGAPQRELARSADLAQYDVAGVTLDLIIGQHRLASWLISPSSIAFASRHATAD